MWRWFLRLRNAGKKHVKKINKKINNKKNIIKSGPLAMKKNTLEDIKKNQENKIKQHENIALSLPYEISN